MKWIVVILLLTANQASFLVDNFSKHEKALDHKFATETKYAVEKKEILKAANRACGKFKNSIISTMKNVCFICKENIALEKLESLTGTAYSTTVFSITAFIIRWEL